MTPAGGSPGVLVEPWAPDYGAPVDATDGGGLIPSDASVDIGVEVATDAWAPMEPEATVAAAGCAVFVDGIRRVDARVWLPAGNGDSAATRAGLCGSFAAGTVRCDGRGRVDRAEVRRVLIGGAEAPALETRAGTYLPDRLAADGDTDLTGRLQRLMRDLEAGVAAEIAGADLVVVDGPLRDSVRLPAAVGYVKTHHVSYLPPLVTDVVGRLATGQRTPLFLVSAAGRPWSRYSWYARLPVAGPGRGHPWTGVVRLEARAHDPVDAAGRVADIATRTVCRFASAPHKDPRAPQNLYPIAALERELRRRLGDPALCYRLLRRAAATA